MTVVTNTPGVTVRRAISAPAELVFDAWLDPASLAVWMRPGGIPSSTARVDPWVGGAFEVVMHHAGGPLVHSGVYQVIDRPRRLVFTWISDATHHQESLVTVEFLAGQGNTEVVVTHTQLPDEEAVPSHTSGWTQALELLAQALGPASRRNRLT